MNESSTQENNATSKINYSVSDLYKKAWTSIKKQWQPLLILTLVGVAITALLTVISTALIINQLANSISDNDGFGGAIAGGLVTGVVALLASVYISLIQVVALKKATEGTKIVPAEILKESMNYIGRAILYGLFVFGLIGLAGFVIALTGPLGALLGLLMIPAIIIALFRYVFVQFLIVEPKEMEFMERFKVSQRLSKGIYGTIFLMVLLAFGIGIVSGIVGGIFSAPFKPDSNIDSSSITFNYNDDEDFETFAENLKDEANKTTIDANYVITQVITGAFSGVVSLVVLGAFLELYKQRKHELKV